MQNEIESLGFVQVEIMDTLKNNGTNYLLIFHDSCEESCNSEVFVQTATAGRHRRLRIKYTKENQFDQRKQVSTLGSKTLIVLFKTYGMTPSTELGLGSESNECYRDATSDLYGNSLIDLSTRTHDRLRYCINIGKIQSKNVSQTIEAFKVFGR